MFVNGKNKKLFLSIQIFSENFLPLSQNKSKAFIPMEQPRKYPVDKQTFEKIINGKFVYIDKTDLVYKMTHDYDYVFLSRPRRFGKSLLCSTLKEYFSGNKDLFKGLKIDGLEKEWTKYPVISLSFAKAKTDSLTVFKESCELMLSKYEEQYNLTAVEGLNNRLIKIVEAAYKQTGQQVVIIIDEYDAAMLNAIDNDAYQNQIRGVQFEMFSPLKDLADYLRFVFLTGITKFSQMSIFSTLNNLQDISLMPEYETICGISLDEFLTQLQTDIQAFATHNGYTYDQTVVYFKKKYDGYHFSMNLQDVFNPFSVIRALNDKMFNDYWFDSGTPSSLLKLISKFDIKMEDYDNSVCTVSRFNQPVEKVTDLVPFLYQAGYLTIKDYKSVIYGEVPTSLYTLGYPNNEVRMALAESLFKNYYKINDTNFLRSAYYDFYVNDDLDIFIGALKKFFRRFPFSLNNMNEKHYHSIIYTVLTSYGANISANVETALGKSDLLLRMPKKNYVIELKYDHTTDSALEQIDDRDYRAAFLDEAKPVVKLAIKFSSKDRNITDYQAVEEKL